MELIGIFLAVYLAVCIIWGIVKYSKSQKTEIVFQPFESTKESATQAERVLLLDETIVKYQRLLNNLHEQYNVTYNETEKSKILAKQISTMEKLNRALEKREKFD
jgi:hypothetical protein